MGFFCLFFFLTQSIMWNKIMSHRNFNRCMSSWYQKLYKSNKYHLIKITLKIVHKTVLHWLPWILSHFPNPFLISVLYWLSFDLPQNLSDCYPFFHYLSRNSIFFLIFGFNVLTDFILFLKCDGGTYKCSKWEHTFSQVAAEKTVIFLGHSDFLYIMSSLLD